MSDDTKRAYAGTGAELAREHWRCQEPPPRSTTASGAAPQSAGRKWLMKSAMTAKGFF